MTLFGKTEKEEKAPGVQPPAAPKPKGTPKDANQDTTYFGKNLKITGNVSGEGSLIILGSFDGELILKGQLKVAQGAKIKK